MVPGAVRGLWHTAEDLGHAAYLSYGISPNTFLLPGAGRAREDLAKEAIDIGQRVKTAFDHPRAAVETAGRSLHDWRATIDPTATPQAATATGEFRRQFPIGLNQGELAGDVLSLFYGGAELKPLRLARFARASTAAERAALRASKLGPWSPTAADYMARGMSPRLAEYFAQPYGGRGHHYWGVKKELPKVMGGGYLPRPILESPFNVLKPPGLTNGEMHLLHHRVDRTFWGGKISKEFGGGGWSAKKLGWQRYGRLGRVWYGAPAPLKAAVGTPLVIGAGAAVDYLDGEDK